MVERVHSNCRVVTAEKQKANKRFRFTEAVRDLSLRYFIYYLHPVSANLQFLQFNREHLSLPSPLPRLSALIDRPQEELSVAIHPGQAVLQICRQLGLPSTALSVEPGFRLWVDSPGKVIPIYLLKVNALEPFYPPVFCHWISLTQSYGLPDIEREMLQLVYQFLMA